MQVFIDESGSFSGYGNGALAVVGALCIPDATLAKISEKYRKLRSSLPQSGGEVKGRLLSKLSVDKVVQMLIRNQAIYEATVIDVGAHTEAGVVAYREDLAREFQDRIDRFNAQAQEEVRQTVSQIRQTSLPLFLQAMATMDLLESILQHIPLYFSQRIPSELGSFKWVVDAKDRMGTMVVHVLSRRSCCTLKKKSGTHARGSGFLTI